MDTNLFHAYQRPHDMFKIYLQNQFNLVYKVFLFLRCQIPKIPKIPKIEIDKTYFWLLWSSQSSGEDRSVNV